LKVNPRRRILVCVMTVLLVDLLIFAGGFLFGGVVMACFAAGAVFRTTRNWDTEPLSRKSTKSD
jgi:hypothetical protein